MKGTCHAQSLASLTSRTARPVPNPPTGLVTIQIGANLQTTWTDGTGTQVEGRKSGPGGVGIAFAFQVANGIGTATYPHGLLPGEVEIVDIRSLNGSTPSGWVFGSGFLIV